MLQRARQQRLAQSRFVTVCLQEGQATGADPLRLAVGFCPLILLGLGGAAEGRSLLCARAGSPLSHCAPLFKGSCWLEDCRRSVPSLPPGRRLAARW